MVLGPIDIPICDANDATVTLTLVIDKEIIFIPKKVKNSQVFTYIFTYFLSLKYFSIKQSCISMI